MRPTIKHAGQAAPPSVAEGDPDTPIGLSRHRASHRNANDACGPRPPFEAGRIFNEIADAARDRNAQAILPRNRLDPFVAHVRFA